MTLSNFTYEKFKEIVEKVDKLSSQLNEITEDNYNTYEVEDMTCRLISCGTKLNAYVRRRK